MHTHTTKDKVPKKKAHKTTSFHKSKYTARFPALGEGGTEGLAGVGILASEKCK
jgi:hypothetical protein